MSQYILDGTQTVFAEVKVKFDISNKWTYKNGALRNEK